MEVLDIVRDYLKANGYDGLVEGTGECACLADDLAPCGQIAGDCAAGMRGPCDCGDHDYHILAGKNPPTPGGEPAEKPGE